MSLPETLETEDLQLVNMHDAKTHLSSLVDKAVHGEPFVIAKAGTPQVIVYSYYDFTASQKRTGFLKKEFEGFNLPEDFDTMMSDEISSMFYGK
jgi:prevent-host-death family protein